mgnify:CR=1 FL=1
MSLTISLPIIAKAMAIGLLGAAPTGPSGVLVIRKTLEKGRLGGFLTGFGVTLSDVVYIAITMVGLSLVLGYLENPAIAMTVKLIGCGLLLVFGISTVRNNPLAKERLDRTVKKESYWQRPLSGFLVAIVNPLVVFIYMGLFAFFSLPVSDLSRVQKLETLLFCTAGDVCWWLLLSFLINRLRNRFDLRGIWMINRILGTVLIVASVGWFILLMI